MDLEVMIVTVELIFGGNSSIHSSSLISFNILLFAVSEGKCLVEVIQQDLSSSASATSVAEMEKVIKTLVCQIEFYSHEAVTLLLSHFFFSYFQFYFRLCYNSSAKQYHYIHMHYIIHYNYNTISVCKISFYRYRNNIPYTKRCNLYQVTSLGFIHKYNIFAGISQLFLNFFLNSHNSYCRAVPSKAAWA